MENIMGETWQEKCRKNDEGNKMDEWDRVLDEIRDDTFKLAKEKGWHDEERNFGEQIALIHSELSEALEVARLGWGPSDWSVGKSGKEYGIPSELADVLIRVLAMCGYYNIDIGRALVEKHKYNMTRPHRHGGKVF